MAGYDYDLFAMGGGSGVGALDGALAGVRGWLAERLQ